MEEELEVQNEGGEAVQDCLGPDVILACLQKVGENDALIPCTWKEQKRPLPVNVRNFDSNASSRLTLPSKSELTGERPINYGNT